MTPILEELLSVVEYPLLGSVPRHFQPIGVHLKRFPMTKLQKLVLQKFLHPMKRQHLVEHNS